MAVCSAYQIPHSVFLSWDQDDRDKAIAWLMRQRETCPRCGTRPDEWDPDRGGRRHAYLPQIHRCAGCVAKERTEEAEEMKTGRGLHVVLVRNPEED